MVHYYVNKHAQFNGDHEVHKAGCRFMPASYHLVDLGYQVSDRAALSAARKYFAKADGCAFCCPSIHHS